MSKILVLHENFVLGGDTVYIEKILKNIPPDEFTLIYGGSSSVKRYILDSNIDAISLKNFNSYSTPYFSHIITYNGLLHPLIKVVLRRLMKCVRPLLNIVLYVRLKKFIETLNIENYSCIVVNSGGFYGTELTRLFLKRTGTKCIYILHNYLPNKAITDQNEFSSINEFVRDWIVGSKYIAEQLIDKCGVDGEHVHFIRYGVKPSLEPASVKPIEVRNQLGVDKNDFVILHASCFEKRKGHYYTLNAFRIFNQMVKHSKLVLAGAEGHYKNNVVKLINKLGLEKDVILAGFYSPLEELIIASDLVCLPSQEFETTPLVILLSFACGVPVLTTKRDDFEDILTDEYNALLVPTGDYQTIAEKFSKLYVDISLKAKLIKNGFDSHNNYFSEERMIDNTIELIQRLSGGILK